ncbi:MAG: hypothetical protein ACLFWH_13930 [Actinomycetota bacterium]
MAEIHDFDDTVVAVLDNREVADKVVDRLSETGYDYELLEGDEGKAHLDPAGDSGPGAALKRMLNVFGDQQRVLDHLNQQLDDGKVVISVDSRPEDADEAAKVLQDNGGEFIWKFGTWTYTRAGD